MSKKVIIIGSGLGGLSCGLVLQRKGFDVTVLEQELQVGGCLQCFVRRGAKFETGMHFIGSCREGQTLHTVLDRLGVMDSLTLSALDTDAYNTVSLGGQQFSFPNGREAFLERMGSYFPKEKDALRRYVGIVDDVSAASTLHHIYSQQRDAVIDTSYQTTAINDVLDGLFHDELLKNVLVGDLPLYAAERDKTPFATHAFIMDFYNQSAFRFVGGSDRLAHVLVGKLREAGGEVLNQKRVTHITCDDTRAVGVVTADEQFYPADYVISAIHPMRMLEMLDSHLIRPAFRNRINAIPQTAGSFVVYLKFRQHTLPYMNTNYFGYRSSTPWGCESYTDGDWPKGFLYMHLCHNEEHDLASSADYHPRFAQSGILIGYMHYDEVRQWERFPIGRRGEAYEAFKREHAERLLAELERQIPGTLACVECYYTSTPLTYRDYTGTEGGSLYGIAKDVTLGAAGRVPYRTKIPNLFLAGQNVNSHGIMGVLVSTFVTTSEILKNDEK